MDTNSRNVTTTTTIKFNNITSSSNKNKSAVCIKNAWKSYVKEDYVIKDLNMTVPQGTIYGLIGGSGCGKTTILSCIVGLHKFSSGSISVFGATPGSKSSETHKTSDEVIGYMPQDICLYPYFTIEESLKYFGRLCGMTESEIYERTDYLINFLHLPEKWRRVDTLSGGQKRRTSLAVALLHEPRLLILDEPTVGVDALLRERIWNHLYELVSQNGTTIIITTHYHEEAKGCHNIGILRDGKLLEESSPKSLLEEHETPFLEEIVLKLCKDYDENQENLQVPVKRRLSDISIHLKSLNNKTFKQKPENNNVTGISYQQSFSLEVTNQLEFTNVGSSELEEEPTCPKLFYHSLWKSFKRIEALTIRNAIYLARNRLLIVFLLAISILNLIIIKLLVGKEPIDIKFGMVSPEVNNGTCENFQDVGTCSLEMLSCRFANAIPNVLNLIPKDSVNEALEDVQQGKLLGYMAFPNNYSIHMVNRGLEGKLSGNETIEGSFINFRVDFSNYHKSFILVKTVYNSFVTYAKQLLENCGANPLHAEPSLKFRKPIYGSFEPTFQNFFAPGFLIILTFCQSAVSTSLPTIRDKNDGTLDRTLINGASPWEIVIARFLIEIPVVLLNSLTALGTMVWIYQMEVQGSFSAILILLVICGLGGVSFGILVAELFQTEYETVTICTGLYYQSFFLCGIIWPEEAISTIVRYIGYAYPYGRAVGSIRSILERGWSWSHPQVWPGYAILVFYIIFYCTCAYVLRRRSK